jgi:hypothetical protein
MGNKKYVIDLTPEQRQHFTELTRNKTTPIKEITRARTLLLSDQHHLEGSKTAQDINKAFGIPLKTIYQIRKRFITLAEKSILNQDSSGILPLNLISDDEKKRSTNPKVPHK